MHEFMHELILINVSTYASSFCMKIHSVLYSLLIKFMLLFISNLRPGFSCMFDVWNSNGITHSWCEAVFVFESPGEMLRLQWVPFEGPHGVFETWPVVIPAGRGSLLFIHEGGGDAGHCRRVDLWSQPQRQMNPDWSTCLREWWEHPGTGAEFVCI